MEHVHALDEQAPDFFGRLVEAWFAEWNSRDPQRLVGMMAPDCEFTDTGWPAVMRGPEQARVFFEHIFTAFPDVVMERDGGVMVEPGKRRVSYRWTMTATHTGVIEPPGLGATGKSIELPGCDVLEYEGEKVTKLWTCWDMAEMQRQLGVMPPMHSKTERMMAKMNRSKNLFGLLGR